jgi:UDPglucose 6-dehydrogenase
VCSDIPAVIRTNFVNAELAKLAVNTYLGLKISYANTLAQLCEGLPGAHVDEVTEVLGKDRRIGPGFLKGALPFGGPCLPGDQRALRWLGRKLGREVALASTIDRFNADLGHQLVQRVRDPLPPEGRVAILGLAFKPDTDVITESPGLALARALVAEGTSVTAFDPWATEGARRELSDAVDLAGSVSECARAADVVVVTTAWAGFRALSPDDLRRDGDPPIILDAWRILNPGALSGVARVERVGVGSPPDAGV